MRITVKVKTGARVENVEQIEKTIYKVSVKEQPEDGKANEAVINLIAKFFKVPKSHVSIVTGHTYKQKVIDVGV